MLQKDLETNFELTIIKELNSSKVSAEEHSAGVINNLDNIISLLDNGETSNRIKELLFNIIDEMQYQDLNRQKIERVMNLLIEKHNICKEILVKENIKLSPSAHHIDHEDGECLSDEELEKMIAEVNAGKY
jgi:chemotaxis regulatin CheY-phosphate phosphatase CheZ